MKNLIETEFDQFYNLLEEFELLTESYFDILEKAAKSGDKETQEELKTFLSYDEFYEQLPVEFRELKINFTEYFNFLKRIFDLNGSRYLEKSANTQTDFIDGHHIIFKVFGGEDKISNLIALKRNSHLMAHKIFLETYNYKL